MKKFTYEIVQDSDPMNPRIEWDNITTMVCFHNRYNLGDKTEYKSSQFNSWGELREQIESDYKVLMIKPLYLYDHSGITISTKPFGCQWDSGQVGWVFIDEKQLKMMVGDVSGHNETNLEEIIKAEVETYDAYLTGEVYGYKVYTEEKCTLGHLHTDEVDSCWGYYSEESAIEDAEGMVKYLESKEEVNTPPVM